jgi:hypothetical protein
METREQRVEVAPGHVLSLLCRAAGPAVGDDNEAAAAHPHDNQQGGGDATACDVWLPANALLCSYLAHNPTLLVRCR